MTGISLHMQWPLTSQLHGSVSQREELFFLLRIKLHALLRLGVSLPSFDTGARNGVLPLITEENWPGQGLNQGLPNDTPALYPLLHKLMLIYKRLFLIIILWTAESPTLPQVPLEGYMGL
jgi:hypothetical protein